MPSDSTVIVDADRVEVEPLALTASDEIFSRRLPAPPTPSAPTSTLLAIAFEALQMIDDIAAVAIVERLTLALVDRDEQLVTTRELLRVAVSQLHEQHAEVVRLRRRLAAHLSERRRAKTAVP